MRLLPSLQEFDASETAKEDSGKLALYFWNNSRFAAISVGLELSRYFPPSSAAVSCHFLNAPYYKRIAISGSCLEFI
jgi:hypothetical protein